MYETKDWYFLYKCRCCGKVYNPSITRGTSLQVAVPVISDFSLGKDISDAVCNGVPKQVMHICDDNTFGLADFIGVTSNTPERNRAERV